MLPLHCGMFRPVIGRWLLLCCLGIIFCTTGCKPTEQISKYTAPHEATSEDVEPDLPEPAAAGQRILGLIAEGQAVNGQPQWWFFKLRGSPEAVGRREAGLKQFAASLKIPSDNEKIPKFDLPKGWKVARANKEFVLFVIRTGHSFTPLDLEVSQVGGSLLQNVNRWRVQQLDMEKGAWTQEQLDKLTSQDPEKADPNAELRPLKVEKDAKKIYWVDLRGPGAKKNMMAPFMKE
jgi:hypothetical protein